MFNIVNIFKRPKILTFKDLVFTEDEISKSAREFLVKEILPLESHLSDNITDVIGRTLLRMQNLYSARIAFNNGYFISVKLGNQFWSNGVDTYEVYSNLDGNATGYLTSEEVTEYMIKIQNA